jgi:BspA type Leucine rich repeat region (6 copies)
LTSITIPNVANLQNKVFANCRGLISVNIPASVTTISLTAFAECSALTSFTVDAANPNFSSLNGLLTNKDQTRLITAPGGVSGNLSIPVSLTEIGNQAFQYCSELTGVTFHAGVTLLGSQSFSTCSKLINALFLGNPPTDMAPNAFEFAAQGFAIYYVVNDTGFTSPTWYDYPAYDIGQITSEFDWLYSYGLPGNSDLLADTNGDGVNLLMAYALNMNPGERNSLPQPVRGENHMSLSFYAGRAGITYVVKTSENLTDWTTELPLSEPDTNQKRTVTLDFSGPARFMRLEVSN